MSLSRIELKSPEGGGGYVLAVPSGSIVTDNDYSLPVYATAAAAAAAAARVLPPSATHQFKLPRKLSSVPSSFNLHRTPSPAARVTPSHKCLAQLPPPCSSNSCRCFRFSIGVLFYNGFCLGVTVNEGCTHAARCCPHAHLQAVADEVERENGGEENEVQARLF
jgi:hypothetical protein